MAAVHLHRGRRVRLSVQRMLKVFTNVSRPRGTQLKHLREATGKGLQNLGQEKRDCQKNQRRIWDCTDCTAILHNILYNYCILYTMIQTIILLTCLIDRFPPGHPGGLRTTAHLQPHIFANIATCITSGLRFKLSKLWKRVFLGFGVISFHVKLLYFKDTSTWTLYKTVSHMHILHKETWIWKDLIWVRKRLGAFWNSAVPKHMVRHGSPMQTRVLQLEHSGTACILAPRVLFCLDANIHSALILRRRRQSIFKNRSRLKIVRWKTNANWFLKLQGNTEALHQHQNLQILPFQHK